MTRKRIRRVLLVLLLLAALALWHSNCTISVEPYAFASASLPQGWDGARIVHLTDLHGKEFGRDNIRLLRAVEKAAPDLIVITAFANEFIVLTGVCSCSAFTTASMTLSSFCEAILNTLLIRTVLTVLFSNMF